MSTHRLRSRRRILSAVNVLRSVWLLLCVATIQLSGAGPLSAQAYGLETRPPTQPFLNMPVSLPVPSGAFITELAFPNLTFQNPVFLTHLPGTNLLFVCEREGRIYSFHNDPGTSTKTLVLDLSAVTQGWDDCGLLGMAFHPDAGVEGSPNRGYFYVLYQYSEAPVSGPSRPPSDTPAYNRLSRFTIPDFSFVADPASELVLINQHDRHVWHNGGAMFFHPVDGFLYFTIGDEGGANDSYDSVQKLDDKLFGGVFRIDVDLQGGSVSHPIRRQPQSYPGRPSYTQNYYIPNDNPWLDVDGNLLEEFWAHGVRSPHRMTYDATYDKIILGDVGQGTWEEVSIIEKGGNYQWPYKEGFANGAKPPPVPLIGVEMPPIYDYTHGTVFPFEGNCVVGGYVYRGTEHPDLLGKYLFGDNTRGRIWSMDLLANPVQVTYLCNMPSGSNYTGLSSFGVDKNNELYLCKMGHTGPGYIYKLGRASTTGPPVPSLLSQTGVFSDVANLVPSSGMIPYDVASRLFSDDAIKTRLMSVPDGQVILFNEQGEWVFPPGTVFVKHFELVVDEITQARQRLETRVLVVKADSSVYGATYKWRADGSDADLLMDGLDEDITINTATGSRVQNWTYPSAQECLTCHTAVSGHVLGVKTRQLNNQMVYPGTGVQDNQLRTLNHIGMFDQVLNEADIQNYDSLSPLTDTGATLEHRVRSYIDSNCSQCHRPGYVQAFFDATFDTPLAQQGLIDGVVGNDLGIAGAGVIRPQDVARSVLRVRDSSVDPAIRMPPLGRNTVDDEWIALLDQYIESLPGTPVLDPPAITPASGPYEEMVEVFIDHAEPGAAIHYTTDGSDPDSNSTLYTGSFTLTSSATVKAMASASGYLDSTVAQASYTVASFRVPDNPTAVSQGVRYEQYLGAFTSLPDFDSLIPDEVGIRSDIHILPRLQDDDFAFRFTGYVDIPTTDIYTLFTNSEDGSQLFIGADLVVDNDGVHSATEQSGQIALQAGMHEITVNFFAGSAGEVLDVDFESSTMARTSVPASALYYADNAATVFVSDLTVVYDGNPVPVIGTTDPAGLPLIITYDGDLVPPSDAGVYTVVATVDDPVYEGGAMATLTIEQALANVTIIGTNQVYDGTGKSVSVTTSPPSLLFSTMYDGLPQLPVDAGSYAVDVDVIDPNYTGSGSDTLVIDPGSAGVTLSNLIQVFDGTPRPVTVTTVPSGLTVTVRYNGSTTPPSAVGTYSVDADVLDPNWVGGTSGTLEIQPTVTPVLDPPMITPLSGTYDGEVEVFIDHTELTATLYYTMDGSDPDSGSAVYTGPFTLTSSATVKAMASAPGFVDSIVTQADYSVNSYRVPENPPSVSQGIVYEQYLGTFTTLPDFDSLSSAETGTLATFDISPRLQENDFAFRYSGFIDVPQTEVYTFHTVSDDGSQLFIGTELVVDNDGVHPPTDRSGQIALQAGMHAITVTFFERSSGQVLNVDYESPTIPRTFVPANVLYNTSGTVIPYRAPDDPPSVSQGVEYEQYLGAFTTMPDFGSLTPDETGMRSNFNVSPRLQDDDFAFLYSGFIDVPTTDAYTFYTTSDDGSQLFIGTDLVVDNDGLHSARERFGQIALQAGMHEIKVLFFERTGGDVLNVDYESSTMPKTPVPASALFHEGSTVITYRAPDNPSDASQGINSEQYLGAFTTMPDFTSLTPDLVETRGNFDIAPLLQNDDVAVVFDGYIYVPTTDVYTFYTTSDDGSQLFIGTDLVVDNDGLHPPRERSGQMALQAGMHEIKVNFFERSGGQLLTVEYESTTAARAPVPASALYHTGSTVIAYRTPDNPAVVSPGVEYEQYLGTFSVLPDFDSLTPAETGMRSTFNTSPRLQEDSFAFRFRGFIAAPTTDVYTFRTTSDDGSQLFIGTDLVVDNDGVHGPRERSGQIPLEAGLHAITVTFFERASGDLLTVELESSTLPRTLVPASALYHEGSTVITYRAPDNPPSVSPGLDSEQYLGAFTALPDFDSLTPDQVGTRSNFAISPRLQNDNFAFRYSGYIDIPTTDVYTFRTTSDDGSQLFIGTGLVVDNDGLHPALERSGEIALQAGLHAITVTFFERTGGEVLNVEYESASMPRAFVPAAALHH